MAKIDNLTLLQIEIGNKLDANDWSVVEILGRDVAILVVMAIYTTNNLCSGYGQDFAPLEQNEDSIFLEKVSIISSPTRISVIYNGEMSYYQERYTVCGYEDLGEDLDNILNYIQTCFDRISAR